MKNKKDNRDPIDNLEYEKVLEEEIINSYESKFQKETEPDKRKIKFYRLKRTPLEIVNRLFFLIFEPFKIIISINFLALIDLEGNISYRS